MEPSFWHQRWEQNQIAFHQRDINPFLLQYADLLPKEGAIFVPLCGKSRDMSFLAQRGNTVIGAELSELATRAFYEEQSLPYKELRANDFVRFDGEGVRLYTGDLFSLSSALVGPIVGVYDRASLIALPEAMRQRYLAHVFSLLPSGGVSLLVSMWYEGNNLSGPPFSVTPDEVAHRIEGFAQMKLLQEGDILMGRPDLQQKGYQRCREWAALLTKL